MRPYIISESKMRHMHAVADYMAWRAESYGLDAERMYVLGLLHDIGYLRGQKDHGNSGASIICSKNIGQYTRFCDDIASHGITPQEYIERNGSNDIPDELLLLWEADMQIGPDGLNLGYNGRLVDIRSRYGEESPEYKNALTTVNYLIEKQTGIKEYMHEEAVGHK